GLCQCLRRWLEVLLMLITFLLTMALATANGVERRLERGGDPRGKRVTRYRTAILWGAATTLAGAVCEDC
ncbi:MAG: hypothetical protein LC775_18555, partial [Acidobacteria bacterium]|nr:hypothetical protein [Acidobacteriota bacterium]